MKKTYVTTMPDHVGAFLAASRRIAQLGLNITRVSYNKAVDMHTLFIEAEGTAEQHRQAQLALAEIGCLQTEGQEKSVVLLEFILRDEPGSVTAILELIQSFNFNISYMSSQENGTAYQPFKNGPVCGKTSSRWPSFWRKPKSSARSGSLTTIIPRKNYDNSIFYHSYAMGLTRRNGPWRRGA